MDDNVLEILKEKHPQAAPLCNEAVLKGPIDKVEEVLFENIDSKLIHQSAKRTHGSAGPSGMDSDGWGRILCSKQFKSKPAELCDSIAVFARRLCTNYVNPEYIRAYTASRLIPLDKNPGVRPVGVGEVLRRIVGKAVYNNSFKIRTYRLYRTHSSMCWDSWRDLSGNTRSTENV